MGWEYDAMAEIAKRLNITVKYENTSWDAMIPAVSEGQYDLGMTGITIKDERKEKVDFSDAYMRSEMLMIVRGDEARFTDAASFAAIPELLVSAQPGHLALLCGGLQHPGRQRGKPRGSSSSRPSGRGLRR